MLIRGGEENFDEVSIEVAAAVWGRGIRARDLKQVPFWRFVVSS
jgi:hypothetical protein